MSDGWTSHHKGLIGGRKVDVQSHDDGGYRVCTVTAKDFDGSVVSNESGVAIMPPVPAGSPVDLEGETIAELAGELALEGFAKDSIDEIVGHLPAE